MPNVIETRDDAKVREIDADLKNKFRWDWLDRKVTVCPVGSSKEEPLSVLVADFVKKLDVAGKALCTVCDDVILYGSRGWKALQSHATSVKHRKQTFLLKRNYSISSAFRQPARTSAIGASDTAPRTCLTTTATSGVPTSTAKPVVPISDRMSHQQVNLSFSLFVYNLNWQRMCMNNHFGNLKHPYLHGI